MPDLVLVARPDNTKVYNMGTGTTPPAGWSNVIFDDSAWDTPRNDTAYGADFVTIQGYPSANSNAAFRWTCVVPTGITIASITGQTYANDDTVEVYIDGTRVPALEEMSGTAGPQMESDVTALLPAGTHLIAFHTRNTSGFGYSDFVSSCKMVVHIPDAPVGTSRPRIIWIM